MTAFPNKFAGVCSNQACKKSVPVNSGFVTKTITSWATWCANCVPERKAPPKVETRTLTADGRIFIPFNQEAVDLIKTLKGPGGKHGPRYDAATKSWEVSLEPGDRDRLLEVAARLKLDVAESLKKVVLTTEAKIAQDDNLYPFQVVGVNWLSNRQKALLADEMGLGKTVETLKALPINGKALIIVPAGLKYNWKNECLKWRDDYIPVVLEGKEEFRFPKNGEAIITNAEALPEWLDPNPAPVAQVAGRKVKGARPKMNWSKIKEWREQLKADHKDAEGVLVVADEAHRFKNLKAIRSVKVRELVHLCGRIWGLTGTPLDNKEEDLFGILENLNMAYETFSPKKGQTCWDRFKELFQAVDGRFGTEWGTPLPIVPELLRRVMLRRTRNEVLPDLPKKTYTNLIVGDMPEKLRQKLDAWWEQNGLALELDNILPPFEEFSEIRAELAKANIPAMLEYVQECEEQNVPLIVFSSHLSPLDELMFRPGWAVITGATSPQKRQEIVDAFQSGKLKGVGLTIRAGGVGLTLTRAWKALFVDFDWVPGWNSQAEDRLARIGQLANKIEIIRMVNKHPLTLHVLNLLAEKIALIQASVERLMKVDVPVSKSVQSGETAEEYEARMAKIQQANAEIEQQKQEATKQKAKEKVGMIHEREKKKVKRELLPLTPERKQAVRDAFKFMLSVCDGAVLRDGEGFSKPHALVGHWVLTTGLETDQEVESAYFLLSHYYRQLNEKYPVLFS